MNDLDRKIAAAERAFRLLKLHSATATKESIQAAWKRLVVENRRNGGSDAVWRDLNAAKDTALAWLQYRGELAKLHEDIASSIHEMAEGMSRAFDPLRRRRQEREQQALHERARAKAWMDWVIPHQNSRDSHPVSQGWFDLGTKPGMELLHPGYNDRVDAATLKKMQERLDLIQKLHRRELARASRMRRRKEWRT